MVFLPLSLDFDGMPSAIPLAMFHPLGVTAFGALAFGIVCGLAAAPACAQTLLAPASLSTRLPLEARESNVHIFFLNIEAADARSRHDHGTSSVSTMERAFLLHVRLADLNVIDRMLSTGLPPHLLESRVH